MVKRETPHSMFLHQLNIHESDTDMDKLADKVISAVKSTNEGRIGGGLFVSVDLFDFQIKEEIPVEETENWVRDSIKLVSNMWAGVNSLFFEEKRDLDELEKNLPVLTGKEKEDRDIAVDTYCNKYDYIDDWNFTFSSNLKSNTVYIPLKSKYLKWINHFGLKYGRWHTKFDSITTLKDKYGEFDFKSNFGHLILDGECLIFIYQCNMVNNKVDKFTYSFKQIS